MSGFQRRPDGEYWACPRCVRLGYGPDAWHPCTSEFWPIRAALLSFTNCRGCVTEMDAHCRGVVPAGEARAA